MLCHTLDTYPKNRIYRKMGLRFSRTFVMYKNQYHTPAAPAPVCISDAQEKRVFEDAQDPAAALLRYRAAARNGGAEEVYELACFLSFYRSNESEAAEAARLLKRLAKAGHREALRTLAWEYALGGLVRKNDRKAFRLFGMLAAQGDVQGELCVAACYRDGIGTEKNPGAAERWFRYAHKDGSLLAEAVLIGGIRELLEKCPCYTRDDWHAA